MIHNVTLKQLTVRYQNLKQLLQQPPYYGKRRTQIYLVFDKNSEMPRLTTSLAGTDHSASEMIAVESLMRLAYQQNSKQENQMDQYVKTLCKLSIANLFHDDNNKSPLPHNKIIIEKYYLVCESDSSETYCLQYIQKVPPSPQCKLMSTFGRYETFTGVSHEYTSKQV